MTKTLEELRQSRFHRELGRKMCAAFIAQQQGITMGTALKKIPDHIGDVWLLVADFAEGVVNAAMESQFGCPNVPTKPELMM